MSGEEWLLTGIASLTPFIVGGLVYLQRRMRTRKCLAQARRLIDQYAQDLAGKRPRLVRPGSDGTLDRSAWDREVGQFITAVLVPAVGARSSRRDIEQRLRGMIDSAVSAVPALPDQRGGIKSLEYEALIANSLHRLGWTTRRPAPNPPPGHDVMATKGQVKVVLKCTLVEQPVDKSTVQVAMAARMAEQATHAAVVSNQAFTQAAAALAALGGVLLLHHADLQKLDDLCGDSRVLLT